MIQNYRDLPDGLIGSCESFGEKVSLLEKISLLIEIIHKET